jgi:hypothetical protein
MVELELHELYTIDPQVFYKTGLVYSTLVLLTWIPNEFNFDVIKISDILNFIG